MRVKNQIPVPCYPPSGMENHESDIEGSSGPENDISEEEDDDSRISNNSRTEQAIKPSIDPDVLARLKQHGMPFGQEDFPPFFLSPMMASHLAAAAAAAKEKDSLVHRGDLQDYYAQERSPPLRGFPEESLPANQAPPSDSSTSSTTSQTWSFEEQFKQLYELSEDVKRKEFLDELFSFMQKRGTPINRLPIMAKQVLDLYELYNLVIARGGLVDVINKKLWQEIIKGLHLPSSITSAAFTLRTQYMKYLYPYECEKKRLSTPAELQAAIDGNRREGRRASYGPYPDMMSPMSLVGGRHQMNGNGTVHPLHSTSPNSPPNATSTPNARDAYAALELSRVTALWSLYGGNAAGLPDPKAPPQQEALNLEVPTRNSEGAHTPKQAEQKENGKRHEHHHHSNNNNNNNNNNTSNNNNNNNSIAPPPPKRMAIEEPETAERVSKVTSTPPSGAAIHGTHIKINSRGDGRGVDTSLVVSMEINGIHYQGVLFAQAPTPLERASRVS